MRKLSTLLVLVLTLFTLISCTQQVPETPPTPQKNGPIYSPTVDVSLVMPKNPTDYENKAKVDVSDALLALRGKYPAVIDDTTEPTGHEIAIGKTSRPASVAAYEYLYKNCSDLDYGICYRIYYEDGVLAVAATNEQSMTFALDYLKSVLLVTETLSLNNGYQYSVTMTAEEYEQMQKDEILKAELKKFENRWNELLAITDKETVDAFKKLYAFYGEDVIDWFANLWEPYICVCGNCAGEGRAVACYGGGFYYANSARDYDGFLPDIESTRQALVFLRNSGMLSYYGDDLDKAIPEWMQEKIMTFVNSLADPDGYFYHPQWGKNIGTSRRGRDLDWAIDLSKIFGTPLKYPTALDQMAGATSFPLEKRLTSPLGASAASAIISVIPCATVNDCLDSAENMIAWLNTMNFKANSHDNGHTVASLTSQIKAKGLDKVVYDYFINLMEEVQEELRDDAEAAARKANPSISPAEVAEVRKNAENGLWQKEINYVSLSGLYKIGGMINTFGYDLPPQYAMAAVRSAVKAITLTDEPTILVHVFNNWAGLNTQMSNMRGANSRAAARGEAEVHDMNAAYALVRAEAPALINATIEKLSLFQKPDGSFSYYQKMSAATTQGTPVSLGLAEGDVNASMISLTSISNFIFNTMGLNRVPMYHIGHFMDFIDTVENLASPEKITLDRNVEFGFDDDTDLPHGITGTTGSGSVNVIKDPTGMGKGNVLEFVSYKDIADTFTVSNYASASGATSFAIEADYYITKTDNYNNIDDYQFTVKTKSGNVYMYTFAYDSGDSVVIGDASSTGSGNKSQHATVKKNEWFKLRIEFYQMEDGSVRFKIILNGKTVAVSQNFFGSEASGSQPKFGEINSVLVRALMRTDATLYMDNIKIESYNDKIFDPN